jgi:hypothetical protein
MKLVDDVKQAWKWFSVQAMALAVAVQGAWASISDDLKAHVPHWVPASLTIALLCLGIGGRLVRQTRDDA